MRVAPHAMKYAPLAPVHILIGEADDWTPAENCRKLADAAHKDGFPVTLKVYPGLSLAERRDADDGWLPLHWRRCW